MFWSSVMWCNVVRQTGVQVLEKPTTSNIFSSVEIGSMFTQNFGSYLPDYMVPHPWIQSYSRNMINCKYLAFNTLKYYVVSTFSASVMIKTAMIVCTVLAQQKHHFSQVFRLLQQWRLVIHSFGIMYCITGWLLPKDSRQRSSLIFSQQMSNEKRKTNPSMWSHYALLKDQAPVTHPKGALSQKNGGLTTSLICRNHY